jgi:hypothetical protein
MLRFRLNAETKEVGDFRADLVAVSNRTPPARRRAQPEISGIAA